MSGINSREFVLMLKREAIDGSAQSILKSLSSPRVPLPIPDSGDPVQRGMAEFFNKGAQKEQRQAEWFRSLGPKEQAMLASLLEETAEMSALSFCTLIDGVGGPWEGVFEIWAVDSHEHKTLLNPENSEMLHDLLSEVCEEERKG
jgi:hypothetical protein